MSPDLQLWLPLPSAIVWFTLVVYQVYRDRFRTWTEVFFLAAAFFAGAYALSDLFFFNVATESQARTALLASFSSLSLTTLFFMLFGIVFYTRMRNLLFLLILPTLAILGLIWTTLVEGLHSLYGNNEPPYKGDYNSVVFAAWFVYTLTYALVGAWAFYRTYREVARQHTKLTRRMRGLMVAFVLTIALGSATNAVTGFLEIKIVSPFSSLLVIPGLLTFVTLSPRAQERLSVAVRRWKSRRYDIKMAFLTFLDGTLIASKVAPDQPMIDQDLFSGTLDVIQNFMRTSFPTQRGKWLKAITHGDFTLVMERAKYAQITLVLQGEETDQLRRQMRDALLQFEAENRAVLADWKGMPADAYGTEEMLSSFFVRRASG